MGRALLSAFKNQGWFLSSPLANPALDVTADRRRRIKRRAAFSFLFLRSGYEIYLAIRYNFSNNINMKKNIDKIIFTLRKELPRLKLKYKISSLEIFGSVLREDFSKTSDIDILVQFEEPPSLLKFLALENDLSDLLNIKVDLVMKNSLKPLIRDQILSETEPV